MTVLVTACAMLLAGCGGSDAESSRPNGDSIEEHEEVQVGLSAAQIREAMPDGDMLPDGVGGISRPDTFEGQEAGEKCRTETGTACSGVVASGLHAYTTYPGEGDIFWTAFTFDTAENAQVAWKGMVTGKRKGDESDDLKELKVSVHADEVNAYCFPPAYDYSSGKDMKFHDAKVMMRIGGTVVLLVGYDMPDFKVIQELATGAADRVTKVAQGKNPDA
ncbi:MULTISPECIES: hypothetical protein [unclassified Streptomyces]|uniref:hypothetical protein n=1 Tax=unclassified Streptomyces TaxID=2593676 RepID=UPI0011E689DA|nr:hypothetical protein [Streptomyces sp. sk2.1]